MPVLPLETLEVVRRAEHRVSRNTAVRHSFFVREESADTVTPPLADLLRASKGGALRLRFYLALLWQAGGGDERHSVTWPARAWAELLGLPDPERLGDRRIRDAIGALRARDLIRTEAEPGHPTRVILLREDGTGDAYTHPGEDARAAKENATFVHTHRFLQLPPTFWTLGWAHTLSGPGLAMLLVMHDVTFGGTKTKWISPSKAGSLFCLSYDTWSRGVVELRRHGILEVAKRPVSEDFGWRRVRNTYSLNAARLDHPPDPIT